MHASHCSALPRLSALDERVMALAAAGSTHAEIGDMMGITPDGSKAHMRRVIEHFQACWDGRDVRTEKDVIRELSLSGLLAPLLQQHGLLPGDPS